MKQIFVTYKQTGRLKKAVINESKYQLLSSDPSVSELIIYPTKMLMEQNYNTKCSNGSCGTGKQFLNG